MITQTQPQDILKLYKKKNFRVYLLLIFFLNLALIIACDTSNDNKKWYRDADYDGFGNPSIYVKSESQPEGYVLDNTDCDDMNKDIFPNAIEIPDDDIDQNCNGVDLKSWYQDADGDGFGNPNEILLDDNQPEGYAENDLDCNDADPDLNNCKSGSYEGGLSIKNNSDIDELKNYSSITGTLSITETTSLKGLECLTSIGSDFEIGTIYWYKGLNFYGNPELKTLEGLNNLTSIGGSLSITDNDSLTDLTGLDSLNSIGSDLIIYENENLKRLNGLNGIKSINGDMQIGTSSWRGDPGFESLDVIGNDSLLDLNGLKNITRIGGNLEIKGNTSLENLLGLNKLNAIEGSLIIGGNDSLTGVESLNNLSFVNGSIVIGYSVTNEIMDQRIYYDIGNNSLESIDGLNNLASIGEDFFIDSNDSLTDIKGLNRLSSIGRSLAINNNNSLINFDFTGLKNVGALTITDNNVLKNYIAENLRESIIVGDNNNGTVVIEGNLDPSYTGKIWNGDYIIRNQEDINNISEYNFISLNLILKNTTLTYLSGLENIDKVGEDLIIEGNDDLLNLEGLNNISEIGGILSIVDNNELLNLDGLDSLWSVQKGIRIYLNDSLCQNLVTAFVDNLIEAPEEWQTHIIPNKDCSIP